MSDELVLVLTTLNVCALFALMLLKRGERWGWGLLLAGFLWLLGSEIWLEIARRGLRAPPFRLATLLAWTVFLWAAWRHLRRP